MDFNSWSNGWDHTRDRGNDHATAEAPIITGGDEIDSPSDTSFETPWKDTASTWLENWWIKANRETRTVRQSIQHEANSSKQSSASIIARIKRKRKQRSEKSVLLPSAGIISHAQLGERSSAVGAPIQPITLPEFVAEESRPANEYSVSLLSSSKGIGLKLSVLPVGGEVIVTDLKRLADGQTSPAQNCGLIAPGDILIRVNNFELQNLGFAAVTEILKTLDTIAERYGELQMSFRYGDEQLLASLGLEVSPTSGTVFMRSFGRLDARRTPQNPIPLFHDQYGYRSASGSTSGGQGRVTFDGGSDEDEYEGNGGAGAEWNYRHHSFPAEEGRSTETAPTLDLNNTLMTLAESNRRRQHQLQHSQEGTEGWCNEDTTTSDPFPTHQSSSYSPRHRNSSPSRSAGQRGASSRDDSHRSGMDTAAAAATAATGGSATGGGYSLTEAALQGLHDLMILDPGARPSDLVTLRAQAAASYAPIAAARAGAGAGLNTSMGMGMGLDLALGLAFEQPSRVAEGHPAGGMRSSRGRRDKMKSDLEEMQRLMRKRHLYPVVARVSCFAAAVDQQLVLRELADEAFEWRPVHLAKTYSGFFCDAGGRFPTRIVSPRDQAQYRFTQRLQWDAEQDAYVARPSTPVEYEKTFLDVAFKMQGVLLGLEVNLYKALDALENIGVGAFSSSNGTLSRLLSVYGIQSTHGQSSRDMCSSMPEDHSGSSSHNIQGQGQNLEPKPEQGEPCSGGYLDMRVGHALSSSADKYFWWRHQRHLITPEHDSVQRLLKLHSPAERLRLLTTLVDEHYHDCFDATCSFSDRTTGGAAATRAGPVARGMRVYLCSKRGQHGQHGQHGPEVNQTRELSLPPLVLTYLIYYSAIALRSVVLEDRVFLAVLSKWATLFDPSTMPVGGLTDNSGGGGGSITDFGSSGSSSDGGCSGSKGVPSKAWNGTARRNYSLPAGPGGATVASSTATSDSFFTFANAIGSSSAVYSSPAGSTSRVKGTGNGRVGGMVGETTTIQGRGVASVEGRTTPPGDSSRSLMAYFNRNSAHPTDIKLFVDVVSDLLDLLFLLKAAPALVAVDCKAARELFSMPSAATTQGSATLGPDGRAVATDRNSTATRISAGNWFPASTQVKSDVADHGAPLGTNCHFLRLLPFKLLDRPVTDVPSPPYAAADAVDDKEELPIVGLIPAYAGYLNLDMAVHVCSLRGFRSAYGTVIGLLSRYVDASVEEKERGDASVHAESCYGQLSRRYQHTIRRYAGRTVTALQLLQELRRFSQPANAAATVTPIMGSTQTLCLILQYLPLLFRENEPLAVEFTAALYPYILPWNVIHSLKACDDACGTSSEIRTGIGAGADDDEYLIGIDVCFCDVGWLSRTSIHPLIKVSENLSLVSTARYAAYLQQLLGLATSADRRYGHPRSSLSSYSSHAMEIDSRRNTLLVEWLACTLRLASSKQSLAPISTTTRDKRRNRSGGSDHQEAASRPEQPQDISTERRRQVLHLPRQQEELILALLQQQQADFFHFDSVLFAAACLRYRYFSGMIAACESWVLKWKTYLSSSLNSEGCLLGKRGAKKRSVSIRTKVQSKAQYLNQNYEQKQEPKQAVDCALAHSCGTRRCCCWYPGLLQQASPTAKGLCCVLTLGICALVRATVTEAEAEAEAFYEGKADTASQHTLPKSTGRASSGTKNESAAVAPYVCELLLEQCMRLLWHIMAIHAQTHPFPRVNSDMSSNCASKHGLTVRCWCPSGHCCEEALCAAGMGMVDIVLRIIFQIHSHMQQQQLRGTEGDIVAQALVRALSGVDLELGITGCGRAGADALGAPRGALIGEDTRTNLAFALGIIKRAPLLFDSLSPRFYTWLLLLRRRE